VEEVLMLLVERVERRERMGVVELVMELCCSYTDRIRRLGRVLKKELLEAGRAAEQPVPPCYFC
jgi:hypothetical protein